MHCTNCGNEIAGGAQFCTKCGAKVLPPEAKSKKKAILLTLTYVLLALSFVANALLWQAYSTEYDKSHAAQSLSSAVSEVQGDICNKITDYAVSEYDLRQESFRLLGDCYQGLPPRESDFDRLSEKVTEANSSWSSIEEYINAFEQGNNESTLNN